MKKGGEDDDGMDWRRDADKHRSMRHKDGRKSIHDELSSLGILLLLRPQRWQVWSPWW